MVDQRACEAPREFFVNADFDLSLRARWRKAQGSRLARQVSDLAPLFLLAGGPEESLLVDDLPPSAFLDYLSRAGIEHLSPTTRDAPRLNHRFTPFGWNREAAILAQSYTTPPRHPPLDIVQRVNSRLFSARLESELFDDTQAPQVFHELGALKEYLAVTGPTHKGWLIKSSHGNAGIGHCRIVSLPMTEEIERTLAELLDEDGALVVERWRDRTADLCASYHVDEDGAVHAVHLHESVITSRGSFLGALYGSHSPALERWGDALHETVHSVAQRLATEGYYGPVCQDAFVFSDKGQTHLRPLVEINARLHITYPILERLRSWQRSVVAYFRFFASKNLTLGSDLTTFEHRFARHRFDPERGHGVLLMTPPSVGEGARAHIPRKQGVLFVGKQQEQLLEMERAFREAFSR